MTQNPYAHVGGPSSFGGETPPYDSRPQRTSVLAIVALVCSLLCFIPGSGALAVILGGAAIIFISQSRGRLGGLGMAVTAVVLGLLFSVIQIGLVVTAQRASSAVAGQFVAPQDQMMKAIEADDLKTARLQFTPAANAAISDQDFRDFAAAYRAEVGAYQGAPQGLVEMIQMYISVAEIMQGLQQGRQDTIPIPMKFANGNAILILRTDGQAQPNQPPGGGPVMLPLLNIGVLAAGTGGAAPQTIWLVDPATPPTTGPATGGQAPAPPADSTTPEEAEAPAEVPAAPPGG